ncbi:hypothetical protein ACIGFK_01600 [Streptomyces sp. NPDC085524]|uniref:hypothetical protein n=1 Tax=unclassified Streptomyces TaxID=2593676 RepID=UPI003699E59E
MTLLEMGGADDQLRLAGWPEGVAPRCTVVVGFEGVAAGFVAPAGGFDVPAEGFVWGVADPLAVRGEDDEDGAACPVDGLGDFAGTGEDEGAGGSEGCTGMPMAGASAWTPIRLLPMATARIAPTTETGHPNPRSRRPRRPDWSTNTGAEAGSSKSDSGISDKG